MPARGWTALLCTIPLLCGTSTAAAIEPPSGVAPDSAAARACFERFKTLTGEWIGRSTRGWEETIRYRVIAAGSVVMASSFDAHPDESMVTMFAMDGGRLALTHYCVAGNQPRLVAAELSPDGQAVTFAFRDGGNLPSRDKGHMDRAVYRFHGPDRMNVRWTWYQEGREQWLEEIVCERRKE